DATKGNGVKAMAETASLRGDAPTVGAVRANHKLDEARLEEWLTATLDEFEGPMEVQQFQRGASNPNFLISANGRRYVLRKKPPGVLLASAHQVDREHRVMKALGGIGFPVPVMRAYCGDESIIGTAFFVMDFLDGRVFRNARLPGLEASERAAV